MPCHKQVTVPCAM